MRETDATPLEEQTEIPAPSRPHRRWRWLAITCGLLVAVSGAGYGYVAWARQRVTRVVEHAGWRLEYSHVRRGCVCCTSRVESLSSPAGAVPLQSMRGTVVFLYTPVGAIVWDSRLAYFALPGHPVRCEREIQDESISPAELERGDYEATAVVPADGSLIQKRGTPDSWLLVESEGVARWCRPDRLTELD